MTLLSQQPGSLPIRRVGPDPEARSESTALTPPLAAVTSAAPADGPRPEGLRITTGGLLLWGGTVSIGASTVVLLALLSRHLHHAGFANLSTLFGLFFIASLIPSGIPLRAAALEVDGERPMQIRTWHLAACMALGAAVSPLLAALLHIPALAVLFVAAQVALAIPLAIRRGSLIAGQRFDAMGGNLFLEGGARIVLGAAAGLLWGMVGLSAALAVATGVALLAVPRRSSPATYTPRRLTSMLHTWLALVLLGLFVQLDIMMAPSLLSHSAALRYDLAAVPSKGVYLVLVAVSTLIFPHVRVHASRRTVVLAGTATMAIGLSVTGVLILSRHLIASLLGQSTASLPLLAMLGLAMSFAGATGIVINGGIALGVARPWPPLLIGIAGLLACGLTHPRAPELAAVAVTTQVVTLAVTAYVCLWRRHEQRGESVCVRGALGLT